MKARVTKMPICCICGKIITSETDSNNPYPVRPYSEFGSKENRCCGECNSKYVITFRMLNFGEGEAYENSIKNLQSMSKEQIDEWLDKNGIIPYSDITHKKFEDYMDEE